MSENTVVRECYGVTVLQLDDETRKRFTNEVLGQITCPYCKQDDVKVLNDDGPNGADIFCHIENHHPSYDELDTLCQSSGWMLSHLQRELSGE